MSEKNTVELTVVNVTTHSGESLFINELDGFPKYIETGLSYTNMDCLDDYGNAYNNIPCPFNCAPGDKIVMTHKREQPRVDNQQG